MTIQPTLPHLSRYTSRTLRSLPVRERPTYRIGHFGPEAVATYELLAAVIGGERQLETAHDLLSRYGSLAELARAGVQELAQIDGIGPSRAAAIKAALELGRRMGKETQEERPQIRSSADAAGILLWEIGDKEQECFHVIYLDTRHRVLHNKTLYRGTLNATYVRVAEVFREAVRHNAAAVLVGHNHPSGDPTPSPDDIALTRRLVEAGRLIDIEVLDHIVVGLRSWVSLRERGLGGLSST
ncbi:MAG TPA: JAB domain-containing protein [Thermoflexia bacterium]|jgi:DNA repair protein RadC|nr:JAB domain-containing protein [Thermoflexia bacterium]